MFVADYHHVKVLVLQTMEIGCLAGGPRSKRGEPWGLGLTRSRDHQWFELLDEMHSLFISVSGKFAVQEVEKRTLRRERTRYNVPDLFKKKKTPWIMANSPCVDIISIELRNAPNRMYINELIEQHRYRVCPCHITASFTCLMSAGCISKKIYPGPLRPVALMAKRYSLSRCSPEQFHGNIYTRVFVYI